MSALAACATTQATHLPLGQEELHSFNLVLIFIICASSSGRSASDTKKNPTYHVHC